MNFILAILTLAALQARAFATQIDLTPREQQIIAASQSAATGGPHFNSPGALGIHPNTPLVCALAVSGEPPITFAAEKLPAGLQLDAQTGILTGSLMQAGEFNIRLSAKNAVGSAQTNLRIVCGETLALTPPMGWNSYDSFGDSVRESEVLSNAQWLKEHLQPFGWDIVVVDFRWYDSKADGIRLQNPEGVTLDEFGRCIPPTNRFPSASNDVGFKSLADQMHAMGLKFGIHIMRGIPRRAVEENLPIHGSRFTASQAARPKDDSARECLWNRDMYGVNASTEAGRAWYADLARQYASWGVDYVKCDDIANLQRGTNRYPHLEVEALANGLRASGRSIILSLSPGPALLPEASHLQQYANLWRISGDFWDNWRALNHNFDFFAAWCSNSVPGHWPDGDMIPFAHICQRNCDVKPDRWTRFTRDEQLTLMSLWSLIPSPLMLGMNLPDNDAWTTALLTNPEVLALNQQPVQKGAYRLSRHPDGAKIWMRDSTNGSAATGVFNRSDHATTVNLSFATLGYSSAVYVRDLWRRMNLGPQTNFIAELPPHGCVLLQLQPTH